MIKMRGLAVKYASDDRRSQCHRWLVYCTHSHHCVTVLMMVIVRERVLLGRHTGVGMAQRGRGGRRGCGGARREGASTRGEGGRSVRIDYGAEIDCIQVGQGTQELT